MELKSFFTSRLKVVINKNCPHNNNFLTTGGLTVSSRWLGTTTSEHKDGVTRKRIRMKWGQSRTQV